MSDEKPEGAPEKAPFFKPTAGTLEPTAGTVNPPTKTRGTGRLPRVGDLVVVHCSIAPGPIAAALEAHVVKIHPGLLLDLVVEPAPRRARQISLERVPHGARPLNLGPWWEHVK